MPGDQPVLSVPRGHYGRRLQHPIGPDGVHQLAKLALVRLRVKVQRIVENICDRDLPRRVRFGHALSRREKLAHVKLAFSH